MKILTNILALFAVASLAFVPAFLLFTLPFHALASFVGFVACAGVAVKINPEI
jgi:hypothetical protein